MAEALCDALGRGVSGRVAYNADHRRSGSSSASAADAARADRVGCRSRPARIPGIPDLMHHKYVVRDGESVWTGSTNWTVDSWTLQENVIVVAVGAAGASRRVRAELRGALARARRRAGPATRIRVTIADRRPTGARVVHAGTRRGAVAPDRASDRARARAGSDRLSGDHGGTVIATLAEVAAEATVDLSGVVDRTQIEEVFQRVADNGRLGLEDPDSRVRRSRTPTSAASPRCYSARDAP